MMYPLYFIFAYVLIIGFIGRFDTNGEVENLSAEQGVRVASVFFLVFSYTELLVSTSYLALTKSNRT